MKEEEKESLKVELGIPESPYCLECGKPIEILLYIARKPEKQNGLCLECAIKEEKGELD